MDHNEPLCAARLHEVHDIADIRVPAALRILPALAVALVEQKVNVPHVLNVRRILARRRVRHVRERLALVLKPVPDRRRRVLLREERDLRPAQALDRARRKRAVLDWDGDWEVGVDPERLDALENLRFPVEPDFLDLVNLERLEEAVHPADVVHVAVAEEDVEELRFQELVDPEEAGSRVENDAEVGDHVAGRVGLLVVVEAEGAEADDLHRVEKVRWREARSCDGDLEIGRKACGSELRRQWGRESGIFGEGERGVCKMYV